ERYRSMFFLSALSGFLFPFVSARWGLGWPTSPLEDDALQRIHGFSSAFLGRNDAVGRRAVAALRASEAVRKHEPASGGPFKRDRAERAGGHRRRGSGRPAATSTPEASHAGGPEAPMPTASSPVVHTASTTPPCIAEPTTSAHAACAPTAAHAPR